MKRIGLIGGMSWQSSAEYYRLINEFTAERLGGLHSADCLLFSVDFAGIERLQANGDWEEAGRILAAAAAGLERAGAELVVLCTNTMHKVAPAIEAVLSVPFLHLADATAGGVPAAGLGTVGLLGTAFTMDQEFYRDRLAAGGLEVLVPGAADRQLVHRIIYEELCLGVVRKESRDEYVRVIDRLALQGAEGVILGCTEIELLISSSDSPLPVFATSRLHALAAVEAALG